MPIAIFGATGNVGRVLLPLLVATYNIDEIRVVTRRSDQVDTRNASIKIVEGNYCSTSVDNKSMIISAMTGCQRIFIALPQMLSVEEMITIGKFLGNCAKEAGITDIIRLSSLGVDPRSTHYLCSQGPLGDAHVQLESYYADLGLKVISIRPTSFSSNLVFNWDEILTRNTLSTPLGNVARVNWVATKDIAAVIACILISDESDKYGAVIDITGPNSYTGPQLASLLTLVFGKTITYQETAVPGTPDYGGLWSFLRQGGFDVCTNVVQQITGKPSVTLEQCIHEMINN
jgi:uncharacterized protein YbjT (DUF2867 family)